MKKKPEPMNLAQRSALADEAITLDRLIARAQKRLKAVKTLMSQQAELYKSERKTTEGGGWSWTVEGTLGVLRVTKNGDTLRAEIAEDSDTWREVMALFKEARKDVNELFASRITWSPLEDLRADAEELLGKKRAELLMDLITSTGKTVISFETKAPAEAPAA